MTTLNNNVLVAIICAVFMVVFWIGLMIYVLCRHGLGRCQRAREDDYDSQRDYDTHTRDTDSDNSTSSSTDTSTTSSTGDDNLTTSSDLSSSDSNV